MTMLLLIVVFYKLRNCGTQHLRNLFKSSQVRHDVVLHEQWIMPILCFYAKLFNLLKENINALKYIHEH